MSTKALAVWANGLQVGEWRMPSRSAMEFKYAASWAESNEARPLSLSMPLTPQTAILKGKAVECYFDNLLPDADAIRKRLQTKFKTESTEAFDLLSAIGRDCVGAVQLLPTDEKPEGIRTIKAEPLNRTQVAAELSRTLSPSVANLGEDEFRISIAGAQEKSAFLRHNGKWCKPIGSTPTTHIFKLPLGLVGNMRADMRDSVENEWLCSKILAAYDIPIAHCDIDTFGEYKVLIVERFDRTLHSSGKYWLRLMQEDMCQATATPSRKKYEADGGPGLTTIGRILQLSVNREADLITLFKAQLVFWMLAATDGHAKNFSIRLLPEGHFQLTPLYDVLSAWPVIGPKENQIPLQNTRLAMGMHAKNTHYRIKDIHPRHFETLAKQLGISNVFKGIFDEVIANTSNVIATIEQQLPKHFPESVSASIFKGLRQAIKALLATKG